MRCHLFMLNTNVISMDISHRNWWTLILVLIFLGICGFEIKLLLLRSTHEAYSIFFMHNFTFKNVWKFPVPIEYSLESTYHTFKWVSTCRNFFLDIQFIVLHVLISLKANHIYLDCSHTEMSFCHFIYTDMWQKLLAFIEKHKNSENTQSAQKIPQAFVCVRNLHQLRGRTDYEKLLVDTYTYIVLYNVQPTFEIHRIAHVITQMFTHSLSI